MTLYLTLKSASRANSDAYDTYMISYLIGNDYRTDSIWKLQDKVVT